jgi:sugar/nucleoside kinase (ribokinase family)
LILKLGDKGALTCRYGEPEAVDSFFVVDSFVDHLVDGVGAGDALLAYATLGMLATKSHVIATIVGVMAAACECERDGNIPIAVEDVHRKLESVEREAKYT